MRVWPLGFMALLVVLGSLPFAPPSLAQPTQTYIVDAWAGPGRILVLAAGFAPGDSPTSFNPLSLRNYKIYESLDRGNTWTSRSVAGLQYSQPLALSRDVAASQNLLAGGPQGVLFQEDAQLWRVISPPPAPSVLINDLYADPSNAQRWAIATTGGQPVWVTSDRGQTWTSAGLQTTGGAATDIIIMPNGRMFAMESSPGSGGISLYQQNADGTWSFINPPQTFFLGGMGYDPDDLSLYVGNSFGGAGPAPGSIWRFRNGQWTKIADFGQKSVRVIGIDAGPPKTIFANVAGSLQRSTDGGQSWQNLIALPAVEPLLAQAPDLKGYYDTHDGWRTAGRPLSRAIISGGLPAQYFEKGRLEDHSSENLPDPNWRFMYGLLTDELQNALSQLPVGGDTSTVTYLTIHTFAATEQRSPVSTGFTGGIRVNPDGSVFIPYDANLAPAPGHNVPAFFWNFINRSDLFPGGWLHDIGLPLTEAITATVTKAGVGERQIVIQGFQRSVLTFDPANPADWQVELANAGTDYRKAFPDRVPD